MARSFSNVKAISALVADSVSNTIARRGYAASSQGVSAVGGAGAPAASRTVNVGKNSGEDKIGAFKVSWVPNPKTGVYGPENQAQEIDAAELRNMLLKKH